MKKLFKVLVGIISACCVCATVGALAACNIKGSDEPKSVKSCDVIGAGGYGALYDVSIDPYDDDIFATRCDMGGIYMSYDRGKNWERRNLLGVLSDIDFDADNEGVIWTTGSGLHKSTDHGKTFELVFPSKDSIIGHGSSYENTGEWYFNNGDYGAMDSLSSVTINRKSGGQNVFVSQPIWLSGESKTRIFQTKNGKDFELFAQIDFYEHVKLYFDESRDCLIVVTGTKIIEIDESGKIVWSKDIRGVTQANGTLSFSSYYDKDTQKNTFAFSVFADNRPHADTALYVTNDLRNESSYRDLLTELNAKKLKEVKRGTSDIDGDYAPYEYSEWVGNDGPVKQSFKWTIKYVHVASSDCIYFYNESSSKTVNASGQQTGGGQYISVFLKYKNGEFTWVYGSPHYYAYDLEVESWQDYGSLACCFGMSTSRNDVDKFAFATIGTVYYTEDGEKISSCHCTVGDAMTLTVKDGNGHEEVIDKADGIKIMETTTNGLNVETTHMTATDPFDKDHLLMACTDIGLIQSFNGGKSWVHTLVTWKDGKTEPMSYAYRNCCYQIKFDKEKRGVVYALWSCRSDRPYGAAYDDLDKTGAFAISYDGGSSWNLRSIRKDDVVIPYRMDVVYKGNEREIYIATFGYGFFVTRDLGKTFTEMNEGIEPSMQLGADRPAIFGNEILVCKDGIFAITGAAAWAQKPDPENPNEMVFDRALYRWNDSLKKFEEIALPKVVACVRDIEYSDKEGCLYISAIGRVEAGKTNKIGGGIYRYKDGKLEQIFDESQFVWGLALDSNGTLYASLFRGEVYRFTENNTKAELLVDGMFHVLRDITIGANDDILYVATFGGGMYRITLG